MFKGCGRVKKFLPPSTCISHPAGDTSTIFMKMVNVNILTRMMSANGANGIGHD